MVSIEYIAGFFDGEGYIQISKARDKSHRGPRYFLHASISNTNEGVLYDIQKAIGGSIRFYNNHYTKHNGCGYHYRLNFTQTLAYTLLKNMLPYLVVKKEQAEIAIRFKESLRPHGSRKPRTDKELAFQDKCYSEIKSKHGNKPASISIIS